MRYDEEEPSALECVGLSLRDWAFEMLPELVGVAVALGTILWLKFGQW